MKGRVTFLLISVVVLAFACGPRPRANDSAVISSTQRVRKLAPGESPLASALDVKVNEGVEFAFHVTNTGARKLEVHFASGQTYDVTVLDDAGREVWRWSKGRMFTQSLQNKVLRASDSLSYDTRWSDAPAGHYVAVATLASGNYPVEQRAEFVVK